MERVTLIPQTAIPLRPIAHDTEDLAQKRATEQVGVFGEDGCGRAWGKKLVARSIVRTR